HNSYHDVPLLPRSPAAGHALIPPLSKAAFLKKATAALKSLSSQSAGTSPSALAREKSCGTLRTASITWDWGMSGPQPHHCWMRRQARGELRLAPLDKRMAIFSDGYLLGRMS